MVICQQCGACCACYRVSFHWYEASEDYPQAVPPELTVRVGRFRIAMRRHPGELGACLALTGKIGSWVACRIYARRPSPCRQFDASWARGIANPLCDKARGKLGLPPLMPHVAVDLAIDRPTQPGGSSLAA